MIDWNKPLELYHMDGRVIATEKLEAQHGYVWTTKLSHDLPSLWTPSGSQVMGSHPGWRIRNVQPAAPAPAEGLSRELQERVVAFVNGFANQDDGYSSFLTEARAIVALLPRPVDVDLVEAREIVAGIYEAKPAPVKMWATYCREGAYDDDIAVQSALAGLRRRQEQDIAE